MGQPVKCSYSIDFLNFGYMCPVTRSSTHATRAGHHQSSNRRIRTKLSRLGDRDTCDDSWMAIAFAAVVLVQPHLFLFEQLFIVTSVYLSSSSLLQFLVKKQKQKFFLAYLFGRGFPFRWGGGREKRRGLVLRPATSADAEWNPAHLIIIRGRR